MPVTPLPENVPPAGVPDKVTGGPLTQTEGYEPGFKTGNGLTVMVVVAVFEQPFALV